MYRDLQLIRHHQHPSGAYPASPTFSQYPYCWLRDGSFIAYAMDRAGVPVSSRAFHLWVARVLEAHTDHVWGLLERFRRGEPVPQAEFLPTRFTLEGEWREDGWPNFQLDGYGQWLWALGEHLRLGGESELPAVFAGPVRAVLDYLEHFWDEPCYDAWEENPTRLHTSTLASVYGGLSAMARFFPSAAERAQEVRRVVLEECVEEGRFVKFVGNPAVDASLLWVSTPFGLVGEDDPRMRATVAEIERTLLREGGLIRYAADTYFGAGAWVLLTAWLGWYYARVGERRRAEELCAWVEARRDPQGHLPEQVAVPSTNHRFLDYWTRQWGAPANPLLWSHALQTILCSELEGS
jgi:GH15 family glucan-1,4-alpha-glucosidase